MARRADQVGYHAGLRAFFRHHLLERGWALALVALVIYAWVAPATITGGDNAEFVTLGTVGGVAHPSGYPLYLLWLRATSWLPLGSPAHATALATALLGAAQLVVLHAACRAWGARAVAATFAVAIFAASPLVLQFYTEAEVFALNGLAVACVLWLAAGAGPLRGGRRVVALAFVAGCGLANHSTCVLVAPVGLVGVARGLAETPGARRLPAVGLALVALAVGLSPYAYLLVTHETQLAWTHLDGLGDLVHHFLRSDYGSGRLTSHGAAVPYGAQLRALIDSLGRAWLWAPLAVGVAGLGYFVVRPPRAPAGQGRRWDQASWAALAMSLALAGPLLLTRFNIDPSGTGLFISQRFHVLPVLLLVVPVAVAVDRLVGLVAARHEVGAVRRALAPGMGTLIACFVFAAVAGRSLPHLMRAQSPATEEGLRTTLEALPRDAVVILAPDSLYFGAGYLQDVLGVRRDVVVIGWPMMKSPEYRARVSARAGVTFADGEGELLSVAVAGTLLAHGRPVFIDAFGGNIARAFPSYPVGFLFRVLPKGTAPPPLAAQYAENKALFERIPFDYPFPGDADLPAADMHVMYARTWMMLAQGLAAQGDRVRAEAAHTMALRLGP